MGGAFGVDVGGSSIKYAVVDSGSGQLLTPLSSIPTPQPGDVKQLVTAIAELARRAAPDMPAGVALPCVICITVSSATTARRCTAWTINSCTRAKQSPR